MIAIIGIAIGIVLGWNLTEFFGAAVGGAIGYLLPTVAALTKKLSTLERAVQTLGTPSAATPSTRTSSAPLSEQAVVSEENIPNAEARVTPPDFAPPEKEQAAFNADFNSRPARPGTPLPETPAAVARESVVWKYLKEYLMGGNTVVRVGVIVLFFGVAFLLKYAADQNRLPIEFRLLGAALGALALLGVGWRLRQRRAAYALALQGGGIGLFYLTVFAALRLYSLIPASAALVVLVAACAFSVMLAVLQNSLALAMLAAAGGFLAPVLTSTGGGSHVMLFSYYALLNAGIVVVAWFKAWRPLNLVGFGFTFVIGALWGSGNYRPEFFPTVEPFLILFVLFYVAIAVLFAYRQTPDLKGYVDGTLVFGTPLIAFSLQAALVRDFEYGLAWSALGLGLFYMTLASLLFSRARASLRTLTEAFLALGVVFGTLAIPLALDGRWTAAAWAIEGAGIFWVGMRQNRILPRLSGLLLQIAAGIALFVDGMHRSAVTPVLNEYFFGGMLVGMGALFSAYLLQRDRDRLRRWEQPLTYVLLAWGLIWWYGTGIHEIDSAVSGMYANNAIHLFVALSCGLAHVVGTRLAWPSLRNSALGLLPVLFALALLQHAWIEHPFAYAGYLTWPLALGAFYWMLYRRDADPSPPSVQWLRMQHAGGLWLLALLLTWEGAWLLDWLIAQGRDWQLIAWGLVPAALLLLVTVGERRLPWPLQRRRSIYLTLGALPLVVFVWCWTFWANFHSAGDAAPLPYVPLLNPLDIAQAFVFLALLRWWLALDKTQPEWLADAARLSHLAYGAALFAWMNAILFRSLHHWAGIAYSVDALAASVLAQSAVSLFWSLLAMAAMIWATRLRQRLVWLIGAGLLGVVVVKLFVVDLSNTGTMARIVSFIGVGVLLLAIGYLSPVPPKGDKTGVAL